jgi:2-C-methyl-D-erythritol 4-phosphate cytidylyltransferase
MASAWAVITAAGSSARMGGGIKKEYRLFKNEPILAWSLKAFISSGLFEGAVLVLPPGDEPRVRGLLDGRIAASDFNLLFAEGGPTRQASVFNGLKACSVRSPELALIHDGARPWISRGLIQAVFDGARRHGGCAPVIPVADALKSLDADGCIEAHLDRGRTAAVQTPQGFAFAAILAAHAAAENDGRTYVDDTEIYARYAGRVHTVAGEARNRKITYPEDLEE